MSVSSQGIRFHEAVRTLTHVGHIKLFLLEHSSCIGLDSVARFNADLSAYAGGMDEDANVRLRRRGTDHLSRDCRLTSKI